MLRIYIEPSSQASNIRNVKTNYGFEWLIILLVILMTVLVVFRDDKGLYINDSALMYASIIAMECVVLALMCLNRRNPYFALLLIFNVIFVLLRVVTLVYFDPYSFVYRQALSAKDYENALAVVALLTPIIGFIAYFGRYERKKLKRPEGIVDKPGRLNILIAIMLTSLMCNVVKRVFDGGIFYFIATYFTQIFSIGALYAITIIYIHASPHGKYSRQLEIALALIMILFFTLSGQKGGVFQIALTYLLVMLVFSYKTPATLLNKFLAIGILAFSIQLYFLGNLIRDNTHGGESLVNIILSNPVEQLSAYFDEGLSWAIGHFSERIGYLDYIARMVKNHELYTPVISFGYYIQSFIDYMLPGTYFNVPHANNAIVFYDTYGYFPSLSEYMDEQYHSNMFTAYGELFVLGRGLFGAALYAVFFMFLGVFVFRFLYRYIIDDFIFRVVRYFELALFFLFLSSFGLDWFLENVVYCAVSIPLIVVCLKLRYTVQISSFKHIKQLPVADHTGNFASVIRK